METRTFIVKKTEIGRKEYFELIVLAEQANRRMDERKGKAEDCLAP